MSKMAKNASSNQHNVTKTVQGNNLDSADDQDLTIYAGPYGGTCHLSLMYWNETTSVKAKKVRKRSMQCHPILLSKLPVKLHHVLNPTATSFFLYFADEGRASFGSDAKTKTRDTKSVGNSDKLGQHRGRGL